MADTGKKANRDLLSSKVRDYEIKQYDDIQSILSQMANSGGFESRNLAHGVDILRSMISEQNCTKFLSFVGSLMSTGARGIIRDMLKNNMFNVVITTCGAIDHDIARTYDRYYAGDFRMDDGMLLENNIHRLGNVLVPMENYGPLIEEKVHECLSQVFSEDTSKQFGTYEIAKYLGKSL